MPLQQFKDKQGKWRWRLKAENGKILMTGEAYASKSNADRALGDLLRAMTDEILDSLELPNDSNENK